MAAVLRQRDVRNAPADSRGKPTRSTSPTSVHLYRCSISTFHHNQTEEDVRAGRPPTMRSLSIRLQKVNRQIFSTYQSSRSFSCSSPSSRSNSDPSAPSTPQLSPRWLSDLKAQAGSASRPEEGRRVLDYLKKNWLELLAGAEGFLAGPRFGLTSHKILWGDMVG